MKKLIVILVAAATLTSCADNNAKEAGAGSQNAITAQEPGNAALTTIEWIDSVQQNLGTIKEGQTPEITWRFRNTGSQPLIIENATGSCGCTVAEKPEQPVMPGEEGVIKAKFNSNGRPGPNRKDVVVLANTKDQRDHTLSFSVVVEGK